MNNHSVMDEILDERKNHIGETDGTNKTVPKDFL
jgi:hypothetical protein